MRIYIALGFLHADRKAGKPTVLYVGADQGEARAAVNEAGGLFSRYELGCFTYMKQLRARAAVKVDETQPIAEEAAAALTLAEAAAGGDPTQNSTPPADAEGAPAPDGGAGASEPDGGDEDAPTLEGLQGPARKRGR